MSVDIKKVIQQVNIKALELLEAKNGVGFFIAVADKSGPLFAKGYGVKSTLTNEPVDAETVFQLASISKVFGGTIIAQLANKKQLDIEKPVGIKLSDPFVTENLNYKDAISQRSGLPPYQGLELEDYGYSKEEIQNSLQYAPIKNFRNAYSYQNFFYSEAVERGLEAAGYTNAEYWAIFTNKLGMYNTSYLYEDFKQNPNKAPGHWYVDGKYLPLFSYNTDAQPFAGGVSSNARDMAQFLHYHVKQATEDTELVPDFYTSLNPLGPDSSESVGNVISYVKNPARNERYKIQGHTGALENGLFNEMLWSGDLNFGIAVVTNSINYILARKLVNYMSYLMMGTPEPIADTISTEDEKLFNQALKRMIVNPYFNKITTPAFTAGCPWAGIYTNQINGAVMVSVDGKFQIGKLEPSQLHITKTPGLYQAVATTNLKIPILYHVRFVDNKGQKQLILSKSPDDMVVFVQSQSFC